MASNYQSSSKTGTVLMQDIFKYIAGNFSGCGRFADIRDMMMENPDRFTAEVGSE